MTEALIVLGPVASGKTTFTDEVLTGFVPAPYAEVHRWDTWARKSTLTGTLGGHVLPGDGLRLGRIPTRPTFGATAYHGRQHLAGAEEWLAAGNLPMWLVVDDNALASMGFVEALNEHTDLLVIRLLAEPDVLEQRLDGKGIPQVEVFIDRSLKTTEAAYNHAIALGARAVMLDTARPEAWSAGIQWARDHLGLSV